LLLVGIYAFALKKKMVYLVITFNDVIGIEQTPVFDVVNLWGASMHVLHSFSPSPLLGRSFNEFSQVPSVQVSEHFYPVG
jgi:hypothetical protein